MGDVLKKVPVREQEPKVRATNFDEVCLGYPMLYGFLQKHLDRST